MSLIRTDTCTVNELKCHGDGMHAHVATCTFKPHLDVHVDYPGMGCGLLVNHLY